MHRNRKLISLSAALIALVVISACSSSASSSSPSASSPSTSSAPATSSAGSAAGAAAASGSVITIGEVCSCSGPFGVDVSGASDVADAWVKSTNASGGLDGHQVQLIFKNDASNPAESVTDAEALVSDHVDAILDLTILDAAWVKQPSSANIPVIGGNFSSDQYYADPDWYPSGQTNDSIVYSNVATAKLAGGTKIGILYCSESVQCQVSVAPTSAAAKQLGVSLVYSGSISATAPNYTAQCLAAKQAGVNALIILDSPTVIKNVAQGCSQQSYSPAIVQEGSSFDNENLTAPGLENSLWADFPVIPYFVSQPSVAAMNTVVDKYYPGLRTNPTAWSQYALQAWSGLQLLKQAVTAAGITASDAVSPGALTRGLDLTSNETLGGFTPPLTFAAGQPHPVDCWYTGRVENGKPVVVNGGKTTCHTES
jgi:branched-chain amino acid transport system substrate-binding protein